MVYMAIGRVLGFMVGKLFPGWLVWCFAKRFIAGRELHSALGTAKCLNKDGLRVSIDCIGEDLSDPNEIRRVKTEYLALIDAMVESKINGDISLKLSHFGILDANDVIDVAAYHQYKFGREAFEEVLFSAVARRMRLWVDAEALRWRKSTWHFLASYPDFHEYLGIRIQAYAADAVTFLSERFEDNWRGSVGVCKGAYREHGSKIVRGVRLRENFLALCKLVAKNGPFLQIDTHDEELSHEADMLIGNVPHEHGLLLGINESFVRLLQKTSEQVNIYGPYGSDVKGYIARRIAERPQYIFMPFRGT